MGRCLKPVLGVIALTLGVTLGAQAQAFMVQPTPQGDQKALFSSFYYQTAIDAAAQGDIATTNDLMGKVQRLNPDNLAIGVVYAEFLQYQKQYEAALNLYESLLPKANSPELKASMLYHTGMAHEALGHLEQAATTVEQGILLMPSNVPYTYYYDLGVIYAKLGRYEDTLKWSQKAVEAKPNLSEAWNNVGFSQAKLGHLDDALTAVKRSLELDAGNANALDSMGYVLYLKGQYPQAIEAYQKAIVADPTMSESFLFLGRSYEATQAPEKAIQAYESYLSIQEVQAQSDVETVKSVESKLVSLRDKAPKTEVATPQPEGNVFLQMQSDESAQTEQNTTSPLPEAAH